MIQTEPQWKINYALAKDAFQQADTVYSSRTGEADNLSKQYEQRGFENSAMYYKQALQDLTGFDDEGQSYRVIFYEIAAQAFACAGEFDMALGCLDATKRQYADESEYLQKFDYYKVQGFIYFRMAEYEKSVDSYSKQGNYDINATQNALKKTLNITAWDGNLLVGCVRILTDEAYFGTITEILVLPHYQGRGYW